MPVSNASPTTSADPSTARRRPGRTDVAGWAAAVAGPLLLYAATMPRTVVLEDDGWFLIVGKFLGVGHPPGYPVHTLLANLFLKIPWGSPALLGHLLSAVLGALACGAVYWCARLSGAAALPALTGAWLLAASEPFWSQAVITEVYTLNALLFFGVFGLLLHLRRRPGDGRVWAGAAFLYGLSLANHWPLVLLATPGLALAALPMWRELVARLRLVVGAFLPAVVLPYGWMVLRSLQEPTFSFPETLNSFDRVVAHISREAYADVGSSASSGWSDLLSFWGWFGGDVFWQLTPLGFVLALVGLVGLLAPRAQKGRGPRHAGSRLDWAGRLAGPVAFVSASFVLLWLLRYDYDFFHIQAFRVFPLICYGLLAVWAAMGLQLTVSWAQRWDGWPALRRPMVQSAAVAVIGVALVAWSVAAHWEANDRSGSDFAQRYADVLFEEVPPGAALLVVGDDVTFPLGYYHFVEGRRPDLRLVEMHGIAYPGSLFPAVSYTTREAQQQALRDFVAETGRPVFHTYRTHRLDHGRTVRDYGFWREVLPGSASEATLQLSTSAAAQAYFAGLFEQEYRNGWERLSRAHQVFDYGEYLGYMTLAGSPELMAQFGPLRELAEQDYYGLIGMATVLAEYGDTDQLDQAMTWLEAAETLRGDALSKQIEVIQYNTMGRVRLRQDRSDEAATFFEKSRDINPGPTNPAVTHLQRLGH